MRTEKTPAISNIRASEAALRDERSAEVKAPGEVREVPSQPSSFKKGKKFKATGTDVRKRRKAGAKASGEDTEKRPGLLVDEEV